MLYKKSEVVTITWEVNEMGKNLELKMIPVDFTICKVKDYSKTDFTDEFCFTVKTDEVLSLVCRTSKIPDNAIEINDKWRALKVQGMPEFSLIGTLPDISSILAEQKIGIFVVSTYNTDYILIKSENYDKAINALRNEGYTILD